MSLALTVSEAIKTEVADGRSLIAIDDIDGARSVDPGRPVRLLDARGTELASGVADPENDVVRLYLFGRAAVPLNAVFFGPRVESALHLRRQLGLYGAPSTCRLLHGEGDGLSGFTADRLGEFAVLYVYSRALIEQGRVISALLLKLAALRGVVLKLRPRGGATPGQVRQEIIGESPPEASVVQENGVPYEAHLLGGLNVGLFTDMREHRQGLGRFTRGRRVLNLFAYTGSLSVAAARGGAESVTSVDLSSGVLRWAAENFRLSGFNPEDAKFRFEVSDVARYVKRAAEAGEKYDLILLDPPTFSAARASAWSMKRDYPALIAQTMALIPDSGGILWLSANTAREQRLGKYLDEGLKLANRRAQILEVGGLPADYPTLPALPESRYLEVCLLHVN